ncbi:MAG: ScyD/ScyE family protein [Anaerolineae bacterium]|nr:ScyD/ScyE family protein [Anaerolineae bacterium]
MLRKLTTLLLLVSSIVMVIAVQAQDEDVPVASGLNAPRHLTFGADGTLYIAEAGTGGDTKVPSPAGGGEVNFGETASISTVAPDGTQGIFMDGLLSVSDDFGQSQGVNQAVVTDTTAWLVLGQGPTPENIPADAGVMTALVTIDLATGDTGNVIDLFAFEQENNPDGSADLASNPSEIGVTSDGTVLIVDASANALLSWTEADGLQLVHAWEVDETGATAAPVPSSLAIASDDSVYIGFLSGFPFAPGTAKIEHWVEGELAETFEGLTLVTDVALDADGNLYAVQFADGFGETGFNPNTGSVVQVSAEGITPIMTGLNLPYGIAQNTAGEWFVSINSAFSAPGSGAVLKVREGVFAPISTPEA